MSDDQERSESNALNRVASHVVFALVGSKVVGAFWGYSVKSRREGWSVTVQGADHSDSASLGDPDIPARFESRKHHRKLCAQKTSSGGDLISRLWLFVTEEIQYLVKFVTEPFHRWPSVVELVLKVSILSFKVRNANKRLLKAERRMTELLVEQRDLLGKKVDHVFAEPGSLRDADRVFGEVTNTHIFIANVKADPDLTWKRALISGFYFELSWRFRLSTGQVLVSSALFAVVGSGRNVSPRSSELVNASMKESSSSTATKS
jgi:hypothetical protein